MTKWFSTKCHDSGLRSIPSKGEENNGVQIRLISVTRQDLFWVGEQYIIKHGLLGAFEQTIEYQRYTCKNNKCTTTTKEDVIKLNHKY